MIEDIPKNKPLQSIAGEGLVKIPPHNLEAEQAVLGAILIDQNALIKIADTLTADDFYKPAHEKIMEAMIALYSENEPIDILSLSSKLTDKKELEAIGGRSYLVSLANSVPTASNVKNYAELVQKKATLRRLIESSQEIVSLGYGEDTEVDALLDKAEQALFKVSQKYLQQNFIPIQTTLTDAFDRIDQIHKDSGKLRGIRTHYYDLDKKLGGLQKSDLIILAARPSMGKTALALDIARLVAVKEKLAVGVLSLEMSKEQLVDRFLCAQAGVDLWKMRTGNLSDSGEDDDFSRIGQAMGVLSEAPIFIDDSAGSNILEIKTKARRLKMEHGLDLLVIDYLQLMEGRHGSESRVQEISEISRGLKHIARELNIPIIALSQLSRAVEQQGTKSIPKLSHLRESGSIEQDADVVMFIYRESYYKSIKSDTPDGVDTNALENLYQDDIAEIIIAKHRNGPTGTIQLVFNKEKASFDNLAKGISKNDLPPKF